MKLHYISLPHFAGGRKDCQSVVLQHWDHSPCSDPHW